MYFVLYPMFCILNRLQYIILIQIQYIISTFICTEKLKSVFILLFCNSSFIEVSLELNQLHL